MQDGYGNWIPTPMAPPVDAVVSSKSIIQGAGAPTVDTPIAPGYIDTNNGNFYTNPTGATDGWVLVAGSANPNQIVSYTSGTPANPPDITKPALAYDPNGFLPIVGWDTSAHTWSV